MKEHLDANGNWRRTVGQVLEDIRGRWYFGILALLAEGPKEPRQMHAELVEIHERLRGICGEKSVDNVLHRPLRRMVKKGMLEHVGDTTTFPHAASYRLSEFSENLLGSFNRLAPWCEANCGYLEQMTRFKNRVDPESPSPEHLSAIDQRSQVGMAFGLFTPRWSWELLSAISEGPRNPRDLFAANAVHIAKSRRLISEKVGYEMLHWLKRCDLIVKRGAGKDETGRVVYEVTEFGRDLMAAFQPIGEAMTSYYEPIKPLSGRRGVKSASAQPRPSMVLERLTYRHLTMV